MKTLITFAICLLSITSFATYQPNWYTTNTTVLESTGTQLRRVADSAPFLNPWNYPPLVPPSPWAATTVYPKGMVVSNSGSWYLCVTNGTSAGSGGPSGNGYAPIGDSGAGWLYLSTPQLTATNVNAPALTNYSYTGGEPPGLTTGYGYAGTSHYFFSGGFPYSNNSAGLAFPVVPVPSNANVSGTSSNATMWKAMFDCDSPFVGIGMQQQQEYDLAVATGNGPYQFVTPGGLWQTNQGGPFWQMLMWTNTPNGSGRQMRHYRLYGQTSAQFGPSGFSGSTPYVAIAPGDTLIQPATNDLFGVAWVWDSIGSGGNGFPVRPRDYIPEQVGMELGWYNIWNFSVGGVGYSNNVSGAGYIYYNQAAYITNGGFYPKVVVLAGGDNDATYVGTSSNAYVGLVLGTFQKYRQVCPTAWIVVLGYFTSATENVASTNTETAISSAFNQWGDTNSCFIPVVTDPSGSWWLGTGDAQTPLGNGNSDFYTGGDHVHPQPLGQRFLSLRIAQQILAKEKFVQ